MVSNIDSLRIFAGSVADSAGFGLRLYIFVILIFTVVSAIVIVSLVSKAIFSGPPKYTKPVASNEYKGYRRKHEFFRFIKTLILIALVIALFGYTNVFLGPDLANIVYIFYVLALVTGFTWYKRRRR